MPPAADPRWLFDAELYRERHPELTQSALRAAGCDNLFDHYLWLGDAEGRSGSLFFDPSTYLMQLSRHDAAQATAEGAFAHFLRTAGSTNGVIGTSPYFDPAAYLARYPAVAEVIAAGGWCCALHHYLTNSTPREFDPSSSFAERFYVNRYPDIALAITAGKYRSAYHHFLSHGVFELRSPSSLIDLRWYVETHRSVAEDIACGRARDAFAHYLVIGRAAGLTARDPAEPLPTEAGAAAFGVRAEAMLPVFARRRLDFTCTEPAALSVVMATRDSFAAAMLSLGALRDTCRGAIELLLVDAGSRDDTRLIERFVTGAKLLRLAGDPEPRGARHAVLTWATAPAILLLDDHAEPAPGAVDAALERLASDPTIGAVSARVIDDTAPLARDAFPPPQQDDFVHDVRQCPELFLLLRATLLETVQGSDEAATERSVCRRIIQAGFRVVYDPAVVAFDHAPRRRDEAAASHSPQPATVVPTARRRVLFIDDTVPLRMIGSGFVRSNDLIGVMASLGFAVTLFPLDPPPFGPAVVAADMPGEVEVVHDRATDGLAAWLRQHARSLHAIWIARTHNLDRIQTALQAGLIDAEKRPSLVLDTEAIVALRHAGEAALHGRDHDLAAALAAEFRNAAQCDRLVAVNEAEAATLRGLGFDRVSVIGHLCEARPTPRRFAERAGLLFLGAIHEPDSPNHDGLRWLIDEVLPLVEQQLGWETRLTVVGYLGPGVSLDRYREYPRVSLRGTVAETERLYDSHRLFVAPIRYAAGLPYKVHEAASRGLPVVATELLRAQLGWADGDDLLAVDAAEPTEFAQAIVRLYGDQALWQRLRDGALARIRAEHGPQPYRRAVLRVLSG